MSELSLETVKNLSELSRIYCTPEEQQAILKDLHAILNYFEVLQEIDTQSVPPCYMVLAELENVLREDEIGETLSRDDFLANAPSHTGGMVRVPSVIKSNN